MSHRLNITNQKFGKLTAIKYLYSNKNGRSVWLFKCECNTFIEAVASSVKIGNTNSCGCFKIEQSIKFNTKHGCKSHKLYQSWKRIRRRCYSIKCPDYMNYGGRGIKLCKEWKDNPKIFIDWATANGWQIYYHIDRIDVNGDYCPENCRILSNSEHGKIGQKRNSHLLTYNNITMTVNEWAKKYNISNKLIWGRLQLGWSVDKILNTPKQYHDKKCYKFRNKTQTLYAWAKELKINKDVLYHRINDLGWSIQKTFTTPVGTISRWTK